MIPFRHISTLLLVVLLLAGCDTQDPAPEAVGPADDDPFVAETIVARIEATASTGLPGYQTTVTAYCKAEGTGAGIRQFQVSGDNAFDRSYTEPAQDSIGVSVSLTVSSPKILVVRCAGLKGDVITDQVLLDGIRPQLEGSIPVLPKILEDSGPHAVELPSNLFAHASSLLIGSLSPIAQARVENFPDAPRLVITPNPEQYGDYEFILRASNGFGPTEIVLEGVIDPATDLIHRFRVAGTLIPAVVDLRWSDSQGVELGRTEYRFGQGRVQIGTFPDETFTVAIGIDSPLFHPVFRTFSTLEGRDVTIQATLHQKQYCLAVFSGAADAYNQCSEVMSEALFSWDTQSGYSPLNTNRTLSVLITNPITGATMSSRWIDAFSRIGSDLGLHGIGLNFIDNLGSTVLERGSDGSIQFQQGSWVLPQTDSEAIETTFAEMATFPDLSDPFNPAEYVAVRSTSMVFDTTAPPPVDEELLMHALSVAMGVRTAVKWNALTQSQRLQLLTDIIARFRSDDMTEWATQPGLPIDAVMGIPQ